ncbi:hypothetical protein GOV14_01555 [Candidatus Pacearchaeota archaeon]|nr:hypothetical protein [Candidatus Pacearchaeota archaeon]
MQYVIKADGEAVRFKKNKIKKTLLKAGASRELANFISNKIEHKFRKGMTTEQVLRYALKLLKKHKRPEVAYRYNLKRAIMSMGPAGFAFEEFISQLLKEYGYVTTTNNFLKGKNVDHEVDVIARKKLVGMVECKYHNHPGNKSDLKVAMYTYARFLDIKKRNKINYPWLITNTKCTNHAIRYSLGVKQKITGWLYPKGESLQELIVRKNLYPTTILGPVYGKIKDILSKNKILMCRDLINPDLKILRNSGIKDRDLKNISMQAKKICSF